MNKPLAVDIREAQRLSNIGRTRLYDAIRDGKVEARKAGRRTLVIVASLEKFLDSLPRLGGK